jgi:hypothetical protein
MKKTIHLAACLFAAGALALTAVPVEAKGKGKAKTSKTAKGGASKSGGLGKPKQ